MIAKCGCQRCGQPVEFEAEHAGTTIDCPHCGRHTVLFIPAKAQSPIMDPIESKYMASCYACKERVGNKARHCPHCGQPLHERGIFNTVFIACIALVCTLILFFIVTEILGLPLIHR